MRNILGLIYVMLGLFVFGQINSYPNLEGFESTFILDKDVEFIPNWSGNEVRTSSRIFQSRDSRSGSFALGATPTGSFDGEVMIHLNLLNYEDGQISFYAKSIKNGTASTRSALVYMATSNDGGINFSSEVQIGDESTFPNLDGQTYSSYSYDLDPISNDFENVVIRIRISRGSGSGSGARFLMDDVEIDANVVVDTTPPIIQLITVISSTELTIEFSENLDLMRAQTRNNYVIDGRILVTESMLDDMDNSLVHLTTSEMINGQEYVLTINNVEDENGNVIATNSEGYFQYIMIEDAESGDIVINEFLANTFPSSNGSGINDDFIELYNNSNKYIDIENYTVEDGGRSGGPTDPFPSYILTPDSYLILFKDNSTIDYSVFGESLMVTSDDFTFNDFNDTITLKDDFGSIVASIAYGRTLSEGVSLELINPEDPCISIASYSASIDSSGGTPGRRNSVFDDIPDTVLPVVSSFGFTTFLTINFSEIMDEISLKNGMYSFSGGLSIDEIIVNEDFPTSVIVTFDEQIKRGIKYNFSVSNVTDCSNNSLEETTFTFGFGLVPAFNDILITEIFFDENPSVGLPEKEYIEIYNASDVIISTENILLVDATGMTGLPVFNIDPGEYKVLTGSSGVSEIVGAIEVTNFPSLNNSGELLILTHESNLIFSVNYDPDWHEDSKSGGGYSLEMIDFMNPCIESGANWSSSIDPNGGTPGSVNSINNPGGVPDNFGPLIQQVTAISEDTIKVDFSEKIDPASIEGSLFQFVPQLNVQLTLSNAKNSQSMYILLGLPLEQNVAHALEVSNVWDCNGNVVKENRTIFALPQEAQKGEILLSEVLFNPRTNGVDFVELYNNSENFLNVQGWKLAKIDRIGDFDDQVIFSDQKLVIPPKDFMVLTKSATILLNNYPKGDHSKFFELPTFPIYANDTGNVILLNSFGEVEDRLFYDKNYHYALLESVEGVSLERVSYAEMTNDPSNWRSAASTEGFATPGYANSQSYMQASGNGRVFVDPEVFIPGNSGSGRDYTIINYQFDQAGQFANVTIYDQKGRIVKKLAWGASLATSGFFRWDGDTDTGGMARLGYYLIIFEIYDSSGNSEIIKETVVVGRDF